MKKLVLLSFVVCLFFIGCVTTPALSPQQRRSLQVKNFESSYRHVFRAFKTVLQDEGYIIKNQDMNGGLIVAQASRSTSTGSMMLSVMAGSKNYRTGIKYEVSVNLEEIRKNYVETRVIIQKIDAYSQGGSTGREIIDPSLYRNIYSKVIVEVERRKAQKK